MYLTHPLLASTHLSKHPWQSWSPCIGDCITRRVRALISAFEATSDYTWPSDRVRLLSLLCSMISMEFDY
jgi:hypothetical protein